MADEKHVPLDAFVAIVKMLYSQINDLTASIMTLRAALMQAKTLPIPPDELKRLHDYFSREYEPLRKARAAMENLETKTSYDMLEFLKNFEGPLQ
jgi:hypothetical protein